MTAPRPKMRRLFWIPIAAACVAVAGAALLWTVPPRTISKHAVPTTVIGEPGSPVPPGLRPPGSATDQLKPVLAPAFSLAVLSPGAPPREPAGTGGGRGAYAAAVVPPAGGRLTLAALRGHPVVINFWGSWCVPCRAEMPLLVKAWHAYGPRGVIVVGFDVDDTPAEAGRFLRDYHVDYPIVTVPDQRLPRAYGVIGLPTTVFVDAAGMLRARQLGEFAGADGERTLMRRLDALLAAGGPHSSAP